MVSRKSACVAVLAFGIPLSPFAALADDMGTPLSGPNILQAFSGRKFDIALPGGGSSTSTAEFESDGTAVYDDGTTGKWRVDGNKLCNHRGDSSTEICVRVFKISDNKYQMIRLDGRKGFVFTAE